MTMITKMLNQIKGICLSLQVIVNGEKLENIFFMFRIQILCFEKFHNPFPSSYSFSDSNKNKRLKSSALKERKRKRSINS